MIDLKKNPLLYPKCPSIYFHITHSSMFIENPLVIGVSFRENTTKIMIQNPEQKYIGKTCKVELIYNFCVLIDGGEDFEESIGSSEFIITQFDTMIDIPTIKRYEYDGVDIQFGYTIKLDIIDAFGLFNATKEESIILKKDLSIDIGVFHNTEKAQSVDILQAIINPSQTEKDIYNWKIMLHNISLPKKIFIGLTLLCILCAIINIILPNAFFGIGPILFPFGLIGITISLFILFKRTNFFIKINEKTKYIIWNASTPIQIRELLEGNSIMNIESLKVKIKWNICEKGKYITGSGTNRRTVTFHKVIQSIVIFEKDLTNILNNTTLETLLPPVISLPLEKNTNGFPITSQIIHPIGINNESKNILGDGLISEIEIRFEHPDFPDKINKFTILES